VLAPALVAALLPQLSDPGVTSSLSPAASHATSRHYGGGGSRAHRPLLWHAAVGLGKKVVQWKMLENKSDRRCTMGHAEWKMHDERGL
jgi:hypothetical protein